MGRIAAEGWAASAAFCSSTLCSRASTSRSMARRYVPTWWNGRSPTAFPGYAAYACAKGTVEVLTRCMAKELGGRGIAVNTVAPGAIGTDFGGGSVRDNSEVKGLFAGMTALGRAGVPDDIGPVIAGLLSGDNRWVNAQRIEVSGGQGI